MVYLIYQLISREKNTSLAPRVDSNCIMEGFYTDNILEFFVVTIKIVYIFSFSSLNEYNEYINLITANYARLRSANIKFPQIFQGFWVQYQSLGSS